MLNHENNYKEISTTHKLFSYYFEWAVCEAGNAFPPGTPDSFYRGSSYSIFS